METFLLVYVFAVSTRFLKAPLLDAQGMPTHSLRSSKFWPTPALCLVLVLRLVSDSGSTL